MRKIPFLMSAVLVMISSGFMHGALAQTNFQYPEDPYQQEQNYQQGSQNVISPMEDIIDYLKQTPQRSSRLKTSVDYALPMLDIGQQTATGYSPEVMDIDGDGSDDLVLSYSLGAERFQMVLLNTGKGYEAAYLCGYTNANDVTGQFTYRGDCADMRKQP
jgi:hypothetical protein